MRSNLRTSKRRQDPKLPWQNLKHRSCLPLWPKSRATMEKCRTQSRPRSGGKNRGMVPAAAPLTIVGKIHKWSGARSGNRLLQINKLSSNQSGGKIQNRNKIPAAIPGDYLISLEDK